MPKERVHHGDLYVRVEHGDSVEVTPYHRGDITPESGEIWEEPSLDVSWNRDAEWVQIGYTAPDKWWEKLTVGNPDWRAEVGYRSVYSGILSRKEINHFIQTLRRARDAAYGSDE